MTTRKLSPQQLNELRTIGQLGTHHIHKNDRNIIRTADSLVPRGYVVKNLVPPLSDDVVSYTIRDAGIDYLASLEPQPETPAPVETESYPEITPGEMVEYFGDDIPAAQEYTYLCMNRPAMWETVPEGYTQTNYSHPDSLYGTVTYPFPLTLEQRYKYQLRLISPSFTPVKGLKICFYSSGKIIEDALDVPYEKYPDEFWYTENEGHVRLADCDAVDDEIEASADSVLTIEVGEPPQLPALTIGTIVKIDVHPHMDRQGRVAGYTPFGSYDVLLNWNKDEEEETVVIYPRETLSVITPQLGIIRDGCILSFDGKRKGHDGISHRAYNATTGERVY